MFKQKILILAANPKDTDRLRLDEELREIDEGLRRATHRDQFELRLKHAVRSRDVRRAFLDEAPQIVHFSGYGSTAAGLIFEGEQGLSQPASQESLASLIELFADPQEFDQPISCVVLNGCYSPEQAEAIAQHVPFVIGLAQTIDNNRRIEFAVGFYDALGAGRSVEFAFKFASAACGMTGSADESAAPVLVNGVPTVHRLPHESLAVTSINWDKSGNRKALKEALAKVYPSVLELEIFVDNELGENLAAITDEGSLKRDIHKLVKWAKAKGCIGSLYQSFCECNADNPTITALREQLSS